MIDWWTETDSAILDCLRQAGPMSPADLARRVALSEGEVTHFVSMLVREGKVRIRLIELTDTPESVRSGSFTPRTREALRPTGSGQGGVSEGVPPFLQAAQ